MAEYRDRFPTMRGRSDLYVGFFEKGLRLLKPGAALGFICADRWMRNQYGSALRGLITAKYSVDVITTMHDVAAFEHEVSAYPAVVVLRNAPQATTVVADASREFSGADASRLTSFVSRSNRTSLRATNISAARLDHWRGGSDLWPAGRPDQLALIADLEARFPPLEDTRTNTRVGIGVATGCDDVFIVGGDAPVEKERLLPLLRATDTATGQLLWSGSFLVNPWDHQGAVDLAEYPMMRDYFLAHEGRLRARHVASRRPHQWYRTIDRVAAGLLERPKLVIPDLKASSQPVLDEGRYYPHHNLYFVVSDSWDLEVLGGLLLSDVANLFVGAYCVKMRGGCYRFQAQYLRRIRVPEYDAISKRQRRSLASAFNERDTERASATACQVYGLRSLPSIG